MNAAEVPPERAEEFEKRFAGRAGRVQNAAGFEAYELLRPEAGSNRYVVYTRWKSKADFEAWVSSPDFAAGHAQHSGQGPVSTRSETWMFEVIEAEYGD
jgi:heme-degrading monooxygenase HmoA